MNRLTKVFLPVISFLLCGCSQDHISPNIDPINEIIFQVEKKNSNENFVTHTESLTTKYISSGWRRHPDGKIQLTREIIFDLELVNGEMLEFGLWFIKYEPNQNELILEDEDLNYKERNWDYISMDVETSNFYQGFDEARVLINNNVIFHHQMSDSFNVIAVEPAIVNGEEKSLITIQFNGEAFGFYDPAGKYQEVYSISGGIFKGIIE